MHEYTVSELNLAIKGLIEPKLSHIRVRGEITNFRAQASGHIYFSLKDAQSQISAVLFKGSAKSLARAPKPGDKVILDGEISLYLPRGSYQIVVRSLTYDGVGELLLKLHQMKEEMSRLGWFDAERKKALPPFPKTIGVITSPTGSVIQDILHVLERRIKGFHLILGPVKVQGDDAARQIARAIEVFNEKELADVLIVGRGGGSLEDLWPFNERVVAEAILHSKIPIVSAVGHETDASIADFVADVRAPTPSAAAELVSQEQSTLLKTVRENGAQIRKCVTHLLQTNRLQVERISSHPLFGSVDHFLGPFSQKIDEVGMSIESTIEQRIGHTRLRLSGLQRQFAALEPTTKLLHHKKQLVQIQPQFDVAMRGRLKNARQKLQGLGEHLASINPKKLLSKGYCIPFCENSDSVIMSSRSLNEGDTVNLLFSDGQVQTEVKP